MSPNASLALSTAALMCSVLATRFAMKHLYGSGARWVVRVGMAGVLLNTLYLAWRLA